MFHLLCQVIESFSYPIQRFYHLFPRSLYFKSFIIFTVVFFLSSPSGIKSAIILTDAGETRCPSNVWDEEIPKMLWEFFPPFFRMLRGCLCQCERLVSSNFPPSASGDVHKGIPQHCQRPLALTVKPDDHFGSIQVFFFIRVWVAPGQCLSKRWYSRPLVFVVVCPVFILLCTLLCTERAACPFQSRCDEASLKFNTETTTCSPQLRNK